MSGRTLSAHRHAMRVALVSTAVVGVAVVSLCVAVDVVVAHSLRSAAADRLTQGVRRLSAESGVFGLAEPDLDDPVVAWQLNKAGAVVESSPDAPALPAGARTVSAPSSRTIGGVEFLVAGAGTPEGRLVVAQSLSSVSRAAQALIVAEAVVAPLLLAFVLLGAWFVGRSVAGPVERARRMQLEFTADASHELRTPLSVIQAETSLALSQPRDPGGDTGTLQRIDTETQRLRRIVEDLLWLARYDAMPGPPSSERVDLGSLAGSAAKRFASVAGQRGMRIEVAQDGDTSALVDAPPEWIDKLVGVLLDNALRHAQSDGGVVRVRVTSRHGLVQLDVSDEGRGIPPEQRARIFDRFHRADARDGGAGLGLAIGDAVVRSTHGRWQVRESPGGGATIGVAWEQPRRAPG